MEYQINTYKLNKNSNLIVLNSANTDLVFVGAGLRAGMCYAPTEKMHIPHIVEHLLFEGTRNLPTNLDLVYEAELVGARINANTSIRHLLRMTAKTDKKHYKKMASLLLEQLYHSTLTEEAFNKEKEVVKQEIARRLDDHSLEVSDMLYKLIENNFLNFQEEWETIDPITYEDVKDFYKEYFTAANTFFILAGSFSEEEIDEYMGILNRGLDEVKEGTLQKIDHLKVKKFNRRVVAKNKSEIKTAYFDLAFINLKELIEYQPQIRVFHALLNNGQGSALFQALRQGLSYRASTGYSTTLPYSKYTISDYGSEEKIKEIFDVCLKTVKKIMDGNFTDKELERAKAFTYGQFTRSHTNVLDLVGWYADDFVLGDEFVDYNEYKEKLLEVTREDIIEVSNIYFKKDNWALALLGKDVEGKEKEYEEILDKYFG